MINCMDVSSITYADRLQLADDFCRVNKVPTHMRERMKEHLKLKYTGRKVLEVRFGG